MESVLPPLRSAPATCVAPPIRPNTRAGSASMSSIRYRALRTEDGDAVFDAAREAWQFTYATIFDVVFIDQLVRTN
jgi:hypothetical protein